MKLDESSTISRASRTRTLVSIHDVMPDTLGRVSELIDQCRANGIRKATLLVVPGLDWTPSQRDTLRRWVEDGLELAGHGWIHRCRSIRGYWHRMHSAVLSRDVAEHLSLSADEIVGLMSRCGTWFVDQGFFPPELYVPPAWALGAVPIARLAETPFTMVETLSGLIWCSGGRHVRLPLVGFEADTLLRKVSLSLANGTNQSLSRWTTLPTRISIHPNDHRLLLRGSLGRFLSARMDAISYGDVDPVIGK